MSRHTLSVLVEDQPGVLARVASLFSRRGFNIESLAVGATELPEVSRMTIVVTVDEFPLEQVTKQLNKLVNVLKIVEQEGDASVARELVLIKVRADANVRTPSPAKSSFGLLASLSSLSSRPFSPPVPTSSPPSASIARLKTLVPSSSLSASLTFSPLIFITTPCGPVPA